MALSKKEKVIIFVSQAIITYSAKMQNNEIPEHQSMIDFVLQNLPDDFKAELSAQLIDDVFTFILEQQGFQWADFMMGRTI